MPSWASTDLSYFRYVAGVLAGHSSADRSGAQTAAILGWETRRRRAADEFGETAMWALAKLQAELAKARPRRR
jgi:hypothetical protein